LADIAGSHGQSSSTLTISIWLPQRQWISWTSYCVTIIKTDWLQGRPWRTLTFILFVLWRPMPAVMHDLKNSQVDPFVISLYLASRLLGIARAVFYMTTFIVGWDRSVCFDQAPGYAGGAQGCLLWRNVMEALSWVLKRCCVEMESFCLT